jgi:CheY-like chemotaxis protein
MNAVIVDDDPMVRTALGHVLFAAGFEVVSFSSPGHCTLYTEASCPCSWRGSCPDLIVSDLDMPEVDGIRFVEHLKRKQCRCKHIAVISGSWQEQDLLRVVPDGVMVFSKPFMFDRIWAWLDEVKAQSGNLAGRDNRRVSSRYPCEFPVNVRFNSLGLQDAVPALARNISRGGILLQCSQYMAPMTPCQLTFKIPEWMDFRAGTERSVMMSAQTRHVSPNSGTYGLQFLTPLVA